jgi:hypothetical protein
MERYNELTDERECFSYNASIENDERMESGKIEHPMLDALDEWDADNGDELATLQYIIDNIEESVFENEEDLINESYFTQYCMDWVIDCGYIKSDLPSFIENNIDWDGVADDLRCDYSSIEIDGTIFYYRY